VRTRSRRHPLRRATGAPPGEGDFDATGVRLRQAPMTPAVVRTALEAAGIA
jgi:hypothetical protein